MYTKHLPAINRIIWMDLQDDVLNTPIERAKLHCMINRIFLEGTKNRVFTKNTQSIAVFIKDHPSCQVHLLHCLVDIVKSHQITLVVLMSVEIE